MSIWIIAESAYGQHSEAHLDAANKGDCYAVE